MDSPLELLLIEMQVQSGLLHAQLVAQSRILAHLTKGEPADIQTELQQVAKDETNRVAELLEAHRRGEIDNPPSAETPTPQ